MAEFAEVTRQAERMCKAHERCGTCPLYDYCDQFNDTRGGQWRVDAGAMEQAVMDWAAEHPEPKYPTWGEWFVKRGDLIDGYVNATNTAFLVERISGVLRTPIPADIAEKLGIEPIKEGEG